MGWKGIRNGNFKNRSVERVHKWRVGDLLMFNDHCPTGRPRWGNVKTLIDKYKTGLVLSVDSVNRQDADRYGLPREEYSHFPEYKSNAKYKQILIQFGNVKHSMWINDNAICDSLIPCLGTAAQIASDAGRVALRNEECLSIAETIETAVSDIEQAVMNNALCFVELSHDDVFKNLPETTTNMLDKVSDGFIAVTTRNSHHWHGNQWMLNKFHLDSDGLLEYRFTLKPFLASWNLPTTEEIKEYEEHYNDEDYDHDVPLKYHVSSEVNRYDGASGIMETEVHGRVQYEFDKGGWKLLNLRLADRAGKLSSRFEVGDLDDRGCNHHRLINNQYYFDGGEWIPQIKQ